MDADRRRRRSFIQNTAIALLSVSAVLLFAQLQIYNLAPPEDSRYLERLMGTAADDSPTALREFSVPVRVVVTDSYGRYGDLFSSTGGAEFASLGLREALGAVQATVSSTMESFRAALSGPSVYFDFLDPLPLSVLAEYAGAEDTVLTGTARCLLLSLGTEGSVRLYLWDGADDVRSGPVPSSALSPETLADLVAQPGMGGVSFAFDDVEVDPLYGELSPLSLLPMELPELPDLSVSSALPETEQLLPAFGFNANTRERYTESDGTEVITEVDADRSLHIRPDGEITYRGGPESPLEIAAENEVPAEPEAVLGVSLLLQELTRDRTGEAELYLTGFRQSGTAVELTYGYHINGVPIRFAGGGDAARAVLSGTVLTDLTLQLRQYTSSGDASPLLPLRQTLAIAAQHSGAELTLGYADRGDGTAAACWLAD